VRECLSNPLAILTSCRPTIQSLDAWANAVVDSSYTWDNLLPYYKKSVHFSPPKTRKGNRNGTVAADPSVFENSLGGPVQVSYPNYDDPFSTWLEKGFAALGIQERREGFNSGALLGWAWPSASIDPKTAQRSSSQTSFLNAAIAKTHLRVYHATLAKRILFNADKVADGVLVDTGGRQYTLSAKKEVILSAGTFQSPQLLMVSGIGPRNTLEDHQIPVLSDLQGVGQNMWDHSMIGVGYRVGLRTASSLISDQQYFDQANAQYLEDSSGPLSSPFGNIAWEKVRTVS
jgi:choline dehydrogenase